ncbi:MAG: diacylglycerol kinase family protein, partial [Clostridia bacterium]|nr:diacylglycerol kinase family protein [Clostridia bacterium]
VRSTGKDGLIKLNKYLKNLPTVTVKGKTYFFINGIGLGLDGHCCAQKEIANKNQKKANYASIALKGFMYKFSPMNAVVTVDGETIKYNNVWLASSMYGSFYGGGLPLAPKQYRLNPENSLTSVVVNCKNRMRIVAAFPSIFKGTHTKYDKLVHIRTGHEIKVELEKPSDMQIDGETIFGVSSYTVRSAKYNDRFSKKAAKAAK